MNMNIGQRSPRLRPQSAGLVLIVACSLGGDCRRDICIANPEDSRCQVPPNGGQLALPQRIYFRDNASIDLMKVNQEYSAQLIFADKSMMPLGKIESGATKLSIPLSQNDKLGPAKLQFTVSKDGSVAEVDDVRLYAKAVLKPTQIPYSTNLAPNKDGVPTKIGIGLMPRKTPPSILVSLNRTDSPSATFIKLYQYSEVQEKLVYVEPVNQAFINEANLLSIATIPDAVVKYYYTISGANTPSSSGFCPNMLPKSTCTIGVQLDSGNSLAVKQFVADRRSPPWGIYAISKDGTSLSAYQLAENDVTNVPVPIPSMAGITDMLVAAGDLDGDQSIELLVWQKPAGKSSALVLSRGVSGFQVNQAYTQALGMALGTGDISAIAAGDLDGDGMDDVIIGRAGVLSVVSNQTVDPKKPTFGMSQELPPPPSQFATIEQISLGTLRPTQMKSTDVCQDIAIASSNSTGWLEVYINNPT
jgi:hypothetical protein